MILTTLWLFILVPSGAYGQSNLTTYLASPDFHQKRQICRGSTVIDPTHGELLAEENLPLIQDENYRSRWIARALSNFESLQDTMRNQYYLLMQQICNYREYSADTVTQFERHVPQGSVFEINACGKGSLGLITNDLPQGLFHEITLQRSMDSYLVRANEVNACLDIYKNVLNFLGQQTDYQPISEVFVTSEAENHTIDLSFRGRLPVSGRVTCSTENTRVNIPRAAACAMRQSGILERTSPSSLVFSFDPSSHVLVDEPRDLSFDVSDVDELIPTVY